MLSSVLSCDVIIWDDNTPLFIFPENFTHSRKKAEPVKNLCAVPFNEGDSIDTTFSQIHLGGQHLLSYISMLYKGAA
jgi:hypothetical protein